MNTLSAQIINRENGHAVLDDYTHSISPSPQARAQVTPETVTAKSMA